MSRLISLAALTFCLTTIVMPGQLIARDDGRFANSPLKPWFDSLCLGPARSTKRTCQSLSAMSAFGGKADISRTFPDVCF